MKPIKPIYVVILVIVFAAGGFYGGVMYQKSHRPSFAGGAGGQFSGRGFGGGAGGQGGAQGTAPRMTPVSGQIVSQDNNSVTVKLSDGSSKIIDLTGQTKITKASAGATSDLKSGVNVTAFGTTNSDGSITAQMVSIGNGMFRMRPGGGQGSPSGSQQ